MCWFIIDQEILLTLTDIIYVFLVHSFYNDCIFCVLRFRFTCVKVYFKFLKNFLVGCKSLL